MGGIGIEMNYTYRTLPRQQGNKRMFKKPKRLNKI